MSANREATLRNLFGQMLDWLGASYWSGPQLPIDLAREIAAFFEQEAGT